MDWQSISELNFGRLLKGTVTPTRFKEELFFPPYDRGFKVLVGGGSKAEIIREIGLDFYQSAKHSIEQLNGAGEDVDWSTELEKTHAYYIAAESLERIVKDLKRNKEPDWSKVNELAQKAQMGMAQKFYTLDEVWDWEPIPSWQKSGVKFFDNFLGGIPKYGLWTIGGRPKGGKTSIAMGIVIGYVKANPDKNAAFFTVEMMITEFKERLKQLEIAGTLTSDERKRIYLCEEQVNPSQAVNWASVIPDLGLVVLDFADLMVEGEVNEQKMTALYRTLALGAKSLKTSVCLLAQLSGSYQGGIPKPHHIRYTRLAEALVVLQLMLYVPWSDWFPVQDEDILPVVTDCGYVIKWMSRYRTRKNAGVPHAIMVKFDDANGWDIRDSGESFLVKSK